MPEAERSACRVPVLLLLAAMAGTLPWTAAAGEEPPTAEARAAYREREIEFRRSLGKIALRTANWCWARDLRLTTQRLDRVIVQCAPEEPDPHVRLGHRRQGAGWDGSGRIPPAVEDVWTASRAEQYRAARAQGIADSVEVCRDLARWCAESRLDMEAKYAWYELLRYRPSDPEARRALGYDAVPLALADGPLRPRMLRERWIEEQVRIPARIEGDMAGVRETGFATLGRRAYSRGLAQASSDRYTVDTTWDGEVACRLVRRCHEAEAAVRLLGIAPPVEPEAAVARWTFLVLSERSHYEKFVMWFTEKDPSKRPYYLALAGFYPEDHLLLDLASNTASAENTIVHKVAEHLVVGGPPWIQEAAACMAVEALGEPGFVRCAGPGHGAGDGTLRDPGGWGDHLLEGLSKGTDRDLASLLRIDLNDLGGTALLQVWSLLWFTRETSPGLVPKLVANLQTGQDPEWVCLNTFGSPLPPVELAWRDWIREQWAPLKPRSGEGRDRKDGKEGPK